ncbi:MAG: glycosyltransferase, partial [Planctomycetes bacterium]|nr:glycosyltransferase [Planctomycetota bacterium]
MDLTIAIPSYKRPELLAATLGRLLERRWQRPVCYLLLINQPDDGYREMLAPYAAHDRVRIVYQREHRSAWQQCCALGNEVDTEYILHVSDDDDVDDEAVERYLGELDNNAG